MADNERDVTAFCPRCCEPFVLAVQRLRVEYELDVVEYACECDLTEDEYDDLCEAAISAFEAQEGER
jgi:hypothetical protein